MYRTNFHLSTLVKVSEATPQICRLVVKFEVPRLRNWPALYKQKVLFMDLSRKIPTAIPLLPNTSFPQAKRLLASSYRLPSLPSFKTCKPVMVRHSNCFHPTAIRNISFKSIVSQTSTTPNEPLIIIILPFARLGKPHTPPYFHHSGMPYLPNPM